jgi:hypothetical protein
MASSPYSLASPDAGLFRRLLAVGQDIGYAHGGQALAVAILAAMVLAPLLLEHDDRRRALLLDDLARDHRAVDMRRAGRAGGSVADQEHRVELDTVALRGRQLLDLNDVVLGHLQLLAAGFDDCVHLISCSSRRGGLLPAVAIDGRSRQIALDNDPWQGHVHIRKPPRPRVATHGRTRATIAANARLSTPFGGGSSLVLGDRNGPRWLHRAGLQTRLRARRALASVRRFARR